MPKFIVHRPELLSRLQEDLKENNLIVIHGISGFGKTVFVRLFCESLSQRNTKSLWVDWNEETFDEQFENILISLEKTKCTALIQGGTIERISSRLKERKENFILIVDNYNAKQFEALKHLLSPLFKLKNLKIIVTSKYKYEDIACMAITPLTEEQSVFVLQSILPNESTEDIRSAAKVFKGYPYAIVRFALTIKNSPTKSLKTFLRSMQGELGYMNVSLKKDFQTNDLSERGIAAVMEDIAAIKKEDPELFEIMGVLSYLDTKKIPLELLKEAINKPDSLDHTIKKLVDQTYLFNVSKDFDHITYDIHEITQKVVSDLLDEDQKHAVIKRSVAALVNFYFSSFSDIYDANREDQIYFNHLQAVLKNSQNHQNISTVILPLNVLSLKRSLYSRRNVTKALSTSDQLSKMKPEMHLSKNELFEYYIDRAFILCIHKADTPNIFDEGISLAIKALKLAQETNSIENQFKALTRLIWLPLYQGNTDTSFGYITQAENLINQAEDKHFLKEFYFGTSWYFLEKGDFDKAYQYADRGLALDENSKNANIGLYLYLTKATCLLRWGKTEACLDIIDKALEREIRIFHTEKSLSKGELYQLKAMAFMEQSSFDQALDAVLTSLSIFEDILGKDSNYQAVAVSLKILGTIYALKQDIPQAIGYLEKSCDMYRTLTAEGGAYEFAEALYELASLYLAKGNNDQVIKLKGELYQRFGSHHDHYLKLAGKLKDAGKEWML